MRVSELADKLSSPDEDIELPTCGGQLGLLHHELWHPPPLLLVAPHRLRLHALQVAVVAVLANLQIFLISKKIFLKQHKQRL